MTERRKKYALFEEDGPLESEIMAHEATVPPHLMFPSFDRNKVLLQLINDSSPTSIESSANSPEGLTPNEDHPRTDR